MCAIRQAPTPSSSFSSLLGDVSMRVGEILSEWFKKQKLPTKGVPYYAQMLVGMTVFTGQYWADQRKVSKEQLAALIVNPRMERPVTHEGEAGTALRGREGEEGGAASRGE